MSAGGDLPPLEGETTRRDAAPPPGVATDRAADAATGARAVDPSQFTHESKLPPLRLEEQKPRLAKGPTVIALAGLGSAIALATAFAFSPSPPAQKPADSRAEQPPVNQAVQLPEIIQQPPAANAVDAGAVQQSSGRFHRDAGNDGPRPSALAASGDDSRRARREMLREEREKALASSLYANIDDPFAAEQKTHTAGGSGVAPPADGAGAMRPAVSAPTARAVNDQNLQGRKNDFLAQTDRSDGYLPNQLVRPRSPYEVKAGTIIPTVLVTGINSDLPGTILGQVRENVYDTVSGNHLLIPQGSKVLASYDSMVAHGQERVLVCWQRLIRPDGTSLSLDCQPGVDLAGYAGFADTVDNHWWRLLTGVALGSVLAAGVVVPQGNVAGYVPTIGQGMAANAAGAINQAGQQITNRALNIQPTIKVRPGFSVNVLVTKDLVIPPYRPEGVMR